MSRRASWRHEHGFTLAEVLITIIVMGIVFAIATSTWFGVIESRRVESASNQIVADLRVANTKATNQLRNWEVNLTNDSSIYSMGPTGSLSSHDLDDDPMSHRVVPDTAVSIVFKPDGSATITPVGANTFKIKSSRDANKCHTIQVTESTSRINIVPC
jgi:prepilin-type N-terminal cleavage/methylation domain-containing protein